MHTDMIYAKVIAENNDVVVVLDEGKPITLQRCRMYNSQIDLKGFLYTDYADKEYVQRNAHSTRATYNKRRL